MLIFFIGIYVKISQVTFQQLLYLSSIRRNVLKCFTRGASAELLLIPFSRINMKKFCPTVIGKYYWNALRVCIRDLTTKTSFRKALRKYDLAQYYKTAFDRIKLVCLCVYLMFVCVPCVSWLCVILCNKSYCLNYICFKSPN